MSKVGLLWVFGICTGVCIADGLTVLAAMFGAAGVWTMVLIKREGQG